MRGINVTVAAPTTMVTLETMSQFLSRTGEGFVGMPCAAASRGASTAAVIEKNPAKTIVSLIRIPGAFSSCVCLPLDTGLVRGEREPEVLRARLAGGLVVLSGRCSVRA